MKTTCSQCGGANDRLPQRYCRSCHNANEQKRQRLDRENLRRLRRVIKGVPIGTFASGAEEGARKTR